MNKITGSSLRYNSCNAAKNTLKEKKESDLFQYKKKNSSQKHTSYRGRISSSKDTSEKLGKMMGEKQLGGYSCERTPREKLPYFAPYSHKTQMEDNSEPSNPFTAAEAKVKTSHDKSVRSFSHTQSMQPEPKKSRGDPRYQINLSYTREVTSKKNSVQEILRQTLDSDYGRKDLIKEMYYMKRVEQSRKLSISSYNEWNNESEKLQQAAKNSVVGGSSEFTEELTDFVLESEQKKAMPHKYVDTYSKLLKNSPAQKQLRQKYKPVLDARRSEQAIMKQKNDPKKRLEELQKAIKHISDLDLD